MKLAVYVVCSTECWRDARDRITAFQKGTSSYNPMEDGRGDHYWYDAEGQLTDAYYGAIDPITNPHSPVRIDYFPYDELGNRTGSNLLASKGWQNFTRKDNGLNQYSGWWPYCFIKYDDDMGSPWGSPGQANGVLMQDGWITGGLNALNQPILIGSPTNPSWTWFGYDPLGRCVKRWFAQGDGSGASGQTYSYYDAWNLVQEGPSPWSPTMVYFHGARVDEVVASWNTTTGMMAYHYYDASGHCTLLTDWVGFIKEQYYYDAFGYPYFYGASGNWLGYSPHGNRFLFTGREWLSELKLYDYRNRLYQPELGRFLQPDPMGFGVEPSAGIYKGSFVAPWSSPTDDKESVKLDLNLYRYCHNDPINRSDPTGLVDLNLFPRGEEIQKNADKTEISPDKFTVGGHGAPDSMLDSNGNEISVQKLGDMIKANPKYDPSKPVELDACQTGRNMYDGTSPFAQRLANYLGSKVIGATRNISIDENGKVTHDTNGYFRTFTPEKKH